MDVARGGGDVFVGDGAPFCTRVACMMQRGGVGGARGLAVQAARRHSRLHRWGMQWLHTRRRGSELHRSFAACSKDHTQVLCTRARRVRIARRGVAQINLSRLGLSDCLRTQLCGVKVACFWYLYPSEGKAIRVPKEAYLKSHPRNTLLVTAASTSSAAEQTSGHTR